MIGQTLKQIWNQGFTLEDFIKQMDSNQSAMRRRLDEVKVHAASQIIHPRPSHVSVLTEAWCGDSLMNLPIVVSFIRQFSGVDLRVFVRSKFPELRQVYQDRGIINIPTVTFLDGNFCELGTWVERPKSAKQRIEAWKNARPEMEIIAGRDDLSRDEKRALLKPHTDQLLIEMEGWYREEFQLETVRELESILMNSSRAAA